MIVMMTHKSDGKERVAFKLNVDGLLDGRWKRGEWEKEPTEATAGKSRRRRLAHGNSSYPAQRTHRLPCLKALIRVRACV